MSETKLTQKHAIHYKVIKIIKVMRKFSLSLASTDKGKMDNSMSYALWKVWSKSIQLQQFFLNLYISCAHFWRSSSRKIINLEMQDIGWRGFGIIMENNAMERKKLKTFMLRHIWPGQLAANSIYCKLVSQLCTQTSTSHLCAHEAFSVRRLTWA